MSIVAGVFAGGYILAIAILSFGRLFDKKWDNKDKLLISTACLCPPVTLVVLVLGGILAGFLFLGEETPAKWNFIHNKPVDWIFGFCNAIKNLYKRIFKLSRNEKKIKKQIEAALKLQTNFEDQQPVFQRTNKKAKTKSNNNSKRR